MNEPREPAVIVDGLYKSFRLPHEQHSGLKQVVVNAFRSKRGYEKQQVLRDVSFEIKKGEFFGIVGRNGSGKSTLLKLLAGIYVADKGQVGINGSLTPFIELGVGFNPELTGRENVYLNGALLGFSHSEMDEMYDKIVQFAELENFMDQKLKNYSSGMQVRLAFSIAIRANSDILLIDEVLAVGDAAFQQKCFDFFETLKERNKTIVLVTHDMGAVQRFCDRALYVKDGNIMQIGAPDDIADRYILDNIQEEHKDFIQELSKHNLNIKIVKEDSEMLDVQFTYTTEYKDDIYVAFSILKNSQLVGELAVPDGFLNKSKGSVVFHFNKRQFNSGPYQITAALCAQRNRRILAPSKNKLNFIVNGSDYRRGGSMRFEDTWEK